MATWYRDLFGLNIKQQAKAEKEIETKNKSFVESETEDGVDYVVNAGGYFGYNIDMSGSAIKADKDLVLRYRDIAQQTECDAAIDDIVNEAITSEEDSSPVSLNLNDVDLTDSIKEKINKEFEQVLELLRFNWKGHDIFRRWYVDGRLYFHKIVDENNLKAGIKEVRYIDSTRIKPVREIEEIVDPITGVKTIKVVAEYYIYQNDQLQKSQQGVRINKDAVTYITSGLVNKERTQVQSYLHKALKPVNQLKMMEDSLVIYRLARAPERRIFYIDIGNLPRGKAEEYMNNIITKYKNKMVYDVETGELKDDKKHMSMLEDFWLPRREGSRGTEITTLPGGDNLGSIDDIIYFRKKVFKSLYVPVDRLEQESQFSLGRSTEITRDEVKFQRFISKIRKKFSLLFMDMLYTQLILKKIITVEEWHDIESKISVDFKRDNYFAELKEAEIMNDRLALMGTIKEYIGVYYSHEWVRKNILQQTDDDIAEMNKQILKEKKMKIYKDAEAKELGLEMGSDSGGFPSSE